MAAEIRKVPDSIICIRRASYLTWVPNVPSLPAMRSL
jgi:hypothetical protein